MHQTQRPSGRSSPNAGFTAMELMVVVAIIVVLLAMLLPVVGMLRESARRQQAGNVVSQLMAGLLQYSNEDPTRSFPAAESDLFIRYDPSNAPVVPPQVPHLYNLMSAMQMDGGLQVLVSDPVNAGMRVLVDPWHRPYRYQADNAGLSDPTTKIAPTRPDPALLNWNAKNQVPFGYVWSLGSPRHGSTGQWTSDPDAVPGSGAPWIYQQSTPGS